MVMVNLQNSVKARKKIFDFNFGELAIKGRGAKGNIVSKHRVRKVAQKEVCESTLGGRDIWLDENIGRLNAYRHNPVCQISKNQPNKIMLRLAIFP